MAIKLKTCKECGQEHGLSRYRVSRPRAFFAQGWVYTDLSLSGFGVRRSETLKKDLND
jgi:hypothetical protein